MNRRHFLAAGSAGALQTWAQANDKVRVAVIGVGSRGSAHIKEMLPVANLEIAALCDPDGNRTEAAASIVFKQTGKRPKIESDMRRIFDDKNVMSQYRVATEGDAPRGLTRIEPLTRLDPLPILIDQADQRNRRVENRLR